MKTIWSILLLFALGMLHLCGGQLTAAESREELTRQVRQAETAFAASMAKRDYKRFASFVAEDAIFFGQRGVLRGKASVVEAWKGYFEGVKAPFSWEPAIVEVLDSGKLALTSGPVRDAQGAKISTFNSIWRREADGSWKVIFDKGCPDCNCNSSN